MLYRGEKSAGHQSCFESTDNQYQGHLHKLIYTAAEGPTWAAFHWINTILGNLKTGIAGTYHAFDFDKYVHRYRVEFQYRFNRLFDLRSLLPRLVICLRLDRQETRGLAMPN